MFIAENLTTMKRPKYELQDRTISYRNFKHKRFIIFSQINIPSFLFNSFPLEINGVVCKMLNANEKLFIENIGVNFQELITLSIMKFCKTKIIL